MDKEEKSKATSSSVRLPSVSVPGEKIPNGYTTTDGKDLRDEWENNPDMIKTSRMPDPLPDDIAADKYDRWLEEQRKV